MPVSGSWSGLDMRMLILNAEKLSYNSVDPFLCRLPKAVSHYCVVAVF